MIRHRFGRSIFALAWVLVGLTHGLPAQSLRLNWSEDGRRCWFRADDRQEVATFYVVDVAARSKTPAFDRAKLAAALAELRHAEVDPDNLPIERIAFTDAPQQILLLGNDKSWLWDGKANQLTAADVTAAIEADRRLFLPPRPSAGSDDSIDITIVNQLDQPLELFWLDTSGTPRSYGAIEAGTTRTQHTFTGHTWLLKFADGSPVGCFESRPDDRLVIDEAAIARVERGGPADQPRRRGNRGRSRNDQAPNKEWSAFTREHNLWLRKGDQEIQLSDDGSESNSYARRGGTAPDIRWSPDSKYLLAFQTTVVPERQVFFIESSPDDQLQPKLQSYDYRKPGDELPVPTLHLYALATLEEIPVADDLFSNPWSLRFHGWSESTNEFLLHYNQRGHQTIRVLAVSVADGQVRTVIEETSPTFLQYSDSGKSVFEDLPDGEILWASERSGWNHLYRYSVATGQLLNAVTSGEWNVKRIVQLDSERKQIWFYAVGVDPDQDPYHEHFCRVNFDGSDFRILTAGDGTHEVSFEQQGKHFIDTYSRVDMAPVIEFRSSENGELICELSREDASQRFGDRRLTERFSAKGRDGQTDIWGIIHWPRDFDPDKKYPVVENIYAGPHDHHVPKSFRTRYGHQHRIADQGMIVVQIDGMGTAWRSKKFHDVCYKNLRDAGFPDRIAWIKAAAEKYPQMDTTRVGIYGGSAGGQNAMAALLWHHDFYKVAVADCGCHDNRMDKIWWNEQWMGWPVDDSYQANSNTANAHRLQGDLMLLVGELDRNVDPASTTQVVRQLIAHDKDFEFVLVAGAGHGSAETPWASRKRLNFLKQHLGVD